MSFSKMTKARLKVAEQLKRDPETKFEPLDLNTRDHPPWMTRAFANNRYVVMIMDDAETDKGKAIRAMVQTASGEPIQNHWAELQRIKNEIFGEAVTAVEYYPKQSDLVDMHHIYWLWIFPDGVLPIPKIKAKDNPPLSGEAVDRIAREQVKIEGGKYMIGTLAFHKLGSISREEEDLFRAYGETDKYWVGMWVTGFGFFDVLFPKETSRELTAEEVEKYNKTYVQLASNPPQKLKVD